MKRFDPNEYVDEHHARVQSAIQRKVDGKEVSLAAPAPTGGASNVVDLLEALKASLNSRATRSEGKERKGPKRAPAPAPAPAARKKSARR